MTKLIKHRGKSSKNIKENTYEAIKLALEDNKYLGVEFDIRETKDHEFVIYHNPMLNNKLISNYLYRELPKFIPRLKDILNIGSSKIFLIEIKNITSIDKFINLLKDYQDKNIYVMSFSNSIINKINKSYKTYKVGVLNYILNTNNDIKKLDFLVILNSILDENIMSKLKGLEIFSYGILESIEDYKYSNVYYIVDD